MEISGELTRGRRATDVFAVAAVAAILVWAGWTVSGSLGPAGSAEERRPIVLLATTMGLLLLFGLAVIGWEWWCSVTAYSFDGRFLRLRTYGRRGQQTINRSEVVQVHTWQNKGRLAGYRFRLADGRQFFFSLQLKNVQELAAMISLELP